MKIIRKVARALTSKDLIEGLFFGLFLALLVWGLPIVLGAFINA